jgi:hypothetical protein
VVTNTASASVLMQPLRQLFEARSRGDEIYTMSLQ